MTFNVIRITGTIMGRIGKREGEMSSVMAAIPVVKTTPANNVELVQNFIAEFYYFCVLISRLFSCQVRAIVMKTWTVNKAW